MSTLVGTDTIHTINVGSWRPPLPTITDSELRQYLAYVCSRDGIRHLTPELASKYNARILRCEQILKQSAHYAKLAESKKIGISESNRFKAHSLSTLKSYERMKHKLVNEITMAVLAA